jgi:hypothetical protein
MVNDKFNSLKVAGIPSLTKETSVRYAKRNFLSSIMRKILFDIKITLIILVFVCATLNGAAPVKIIKISFFPDEDALIK